VSPWYRNMQLFVRSFNRTSLSVPFDKATSVASLKTIVYNQMGVPEGEQRLVHAGRHLSDDECLSCLGVSDNSTIHLLLRLPGGGDDGAKVFVKVLGGKSIIIDILSDTTNIADIQKQLQEREGLEIGKYDLIFCGAKLDPTKSLGDYQIGPNATIDIVLPSDVPKNRCTVSGCTDRVAKIVGGCRYCEHDYCSRHRLPESHSCNNIQGCRQRSYEKNSHKLLGEKCVADKV